MPKIKCTVKDEKLRAFLRKIYRDGVPGAVVDALNRAAGTTRTAISREVSARLGMLAKKTRWRVRFQRRDEASPGRWRSKVFLVISDAPVSAFGKIRQTKGGALARGMFFQGEFAATMKSGHTGVYYRVEGAMKRQISYRGKMSTLPIMERKMKVRTQISDIAVAKVNSVGMKTFEKRLNHELARRLK